MSLLLAEGHTHARRYPVAMVWGEARIARKRVNSRIVTEAVTMQAAILSCLAKEGGEHFQSLMKELTDG